MAARKGGRELAPAITPEARERQITSLAYDLAERQIREGTAPAPTVNHFLKMASSREKLEQERLRQENLLIAAKIEQIASAERQEQMFEDAMRAFRGYSGQDDDDYDNR